MYNYCVNTREWRTVPGFSISGCVPDLPPFGLDAAEGIGEREHKLVGAGLHGITGNDAVISAAVAERYRTGGKGQGAKAPRGWRQMLPRLLPNVLVQAGAS